MCFRSRLSNRAVMVTFLFLAACSDTSEFTQRYQDRWGPDPKMPADEFKKVAEQQHQVMVSIVSAYNDSLIDANGTRAANSNTTNYWLKVTSYGMNVIDQKCDVYMSDLFKLNRERNRNDSILKSMQATTYAIVGAAVDNSRSKLPLLSIASAFGLVESINDEAAKTYLFEQQIPGIVADKVRKARNLYRERTVPLFSESQKQSSAIFDEGTSYRALRDYLTLCLPQTIEGNFLQTYIAADPTVKDANTPATAQTVTRQANKTVSQFSLNLSSSQSPAPSLNFTVSQGQ
jgi:hypothetical protein